MIAVLGFGLVALLTLGGVTLIVRSRRGGKEYPACGRCGYDVTATVGGTGRCPECGFALIEVGVLPPRGKAARRDPLMLFTGIAMLLVVTGCAGYLLVGVVSGHRRFAARQQRVAAQQQAQQQLRQQQQEEAVPAEVEEEEDQ